MALDLPQPIVRLAVDQEGFRAYAAQMLDSHRIEQIMRQVLDDVVEKFDFEAVIRHAIQSTIEESIRRAFSNDLIASAANEIAQKSIRSALQNILDK